jgi:hypothetical protein
MKIEGAYRDAGRERDGECIWDTWRIWKEVACKREAFTLDSDHKKEGKHEKGHAWQLVQRIKRAQAIDKHIYKRGMHKSWACIRVVYIQTKVSMKNGLR